MYIFAFLHAFKKKKFYMIVVVLLGALIEEEQNLALASSFVFGNMKQDS